MIKGSGRCSRMKFLRQTEIEWSKSLKDMPAFTIKEIELHRQNSGKSEASIIKTLERGRKFKNERYLSADYVYGYD